MSRYIIKFKKEGYLRFISHLDLMRLFQRTLKRAGIKLNYSHGYNPHPKMSIAQPLSLGYSSVGDYLEIETDLATESEIVAENLNNNLPKGIEVIGCSKVQTSKKTLAALVEYGSYEAAIPIVNSEIIFSVSDFLAQDSIQSTKYQRKTGIESSIDIKPMIYSLECFTNQDLLIMKMTIMNGSTSNLNPELLIKAFLDFVGEDFVKESITINRLDLFGKQDGLLFSLDSLMI
jgi:radical SAM-linked protein